MARPAQPSPGDAADTVLLLHGQPGSAADWRTVRDALHAIAPSVATLAIDRPGWGASRTSAGSLKLNAAVAVAALDAAHAQRALVVGHSFGAAVAAWLAAEYPERVSALVLVSPAANEASLEPLDRLLALPVAGYLGSASLMAGMGATLAAPPARKLLAGPLKLDARHLDEFGRALRSPSAWAAFAREQRTLIRDLPALEERLGRITAPTAIVVGDQDRIVPPRSARALAHQIAGAELVVIPAAGHLIPFHQAAELAEIVNGRRQRPDAAPTGAPARARTRARRAS